MKQKYIKSDIAIVKFQFMYMTRPHLRVREEFLTALCRNIEKLELSKQSELEFLALAIAAFKAKMARRQEICSIALCALDALIHAV